MARKTIKTMADKMSESGKAVGKDVLDDADLATDPIISALQTLRLTIDDMQYNDANHGTDKQTSAIDANTAKTGITSNQASEITANTRKTGITSGQASAITANTAKDTNVVQTSVTGNAGTATKISSITNDNIVQLAGDQTLTGTKTFSATIVGSVNGNSATTSETTITTGQASTIQNLAKGIVVKTNQLTITKDRSNNLIITDGTSNWVLAAQR